MDIIVDKSLYDQVYGYLKDSIISGKIQPGTRLAEADLAKQMNISRAPIREALSTLISEGFVIKSPRHAAVVAPVSDREIADNWETRVLIEPYCTKIACPYIPKKELEQLKKLLVKNKNNSDFDLYMTLDHRTHSLIFEYIPNVSLKAFAQATMVASMRYRYFAESSDPTDSEFIHDVYKEHIEIVDALINNDAEEAYQCMLHHTLSGRKRFTKK